MLQGKDAKSKLRELLRLGNYESEEERLVAVFEQALQTLQEVSISDLWEQPELAASYWILLLSGVNQKDEMEIATNLLVWKAFNAKDSAKVLCIPLSERSEFNFCSSQFNVVRTPTLVFSDSRDLSEFVTIAPKVLFDLNSTEGHLQRFLTEIHNSFLNGRRLLDIRKRLITEQFWAGTKVVYGEVKSLVSFSL